MLSSVVLMSVSREHDHYYHNYAGGVVLKRFYFFPFAHKGSSNTLARIPALNNYIFINELTVFTIIIASITFCALLGFDFASWWSLLLLNFLSLAALGTKGLMNFVLLLKGSPVGGVVVSVCEFENAGGERKERYVVRGIEGSEFELNDLIPGAYSVGDRVMLLSANEGAGMSIQKGQATVELCIYCLVYVGSCWFIVSEMG